MASSLWTRSLLTTRHLSSALSRSCTSFSTYSSLSSISRFPLLRFRPLFAVSANLRNLSPSFTTIRGLATRQASSSLNDPNPNWSNRPPKETILLDGCDFEHWLVVMEKPDENMTRDEIIDSYIKTLAVVVGSEEEARMKIYSVSTRHYFAFGALVSEELSYKLKELPKVRWVLPDSYLDVKNKNYGGEPFINGQAVPYDPKYHEEWVRNNARANERNRRNDRPRTTDRSRNFERRRENIMHSRGMPNTGPNMGGAPGMGNMPSNNLGVAPQRSMEGVPPNSMGGIPPQNNMQGMSQNNLGSMPVNNIPPNNYGGMPPPNNYGGMPPPNNYGGMPPPNNYGGMPPLNNYGGMPPNNIGRVPPNSARAMPHDMPNEQSRSVPNSAGGVPFQSVSGPNRDYENSYSSNMTGGNSNQSQNIPVRDMPPMPNYQ